MRYNIIKQCSVYYAKFNTHLCLESKGKPLILDRDGFLPKKRKIKPRGIVDESGINFIL